MKAIVFDAVGSPLDVLRLREVPTPEVGPGQVLVEMRTASINPGDFLFIQALYPDPKKPRFPRQIAGAHGMGVVVRAGAGVAIEPGTLVAFSYQDVWAEYVVMPAEWLIPLPPGYSAEKGSQIMNFITAWDLLDETALKPGQWLALTAGNATVSTMVAQMARLRGIKVLSIVRQVQSDLDLRSMGSTEVIALTSDSSRLPSRILEITNGAGLGAAIDCVGGRIMGDLIQSFAGFGGQIVIYGGFSHDRFELHNFDVLMRGLTIKPYAYRYFFEPPKPGDAALLQQIVEVVGRADFKIRVAAAHPLDDFTTAVRESIERSERGKHFFVMSPSGRESAAGRE